VKDDWKNFKKQKTNKKHSCRTHTKAENKLGSDLFCIVRDHSDPFDGARGSL
jgi:hypothetical protein